MEFKEFLVAITVENSPIKGAHLKVKLEKRTASPQVSGFKHRSFLPPENPKKMSCPGAIWSYLISSKWHFFYGFSSDFQLKDSRFFTWSSRKTFASMVLRFLKKCKKQKRTQDSLQVSLSLFLVELFVVFLPPATSKSLENCPQVAPNESNYTG